MKDRWKLCWNALRIFEVELHSNQKSIDEIKIFLIPGNDGRSLMVDAGFRSRTCLHVMEEALGKLGITYDRLDIPYPQAS